MSAFNPRFRRAPPTGFELSNCLTQVIDREEPIETLTMAGGTLLHTFSINPLNSGTFKWLSRIA